MEKLSAVLEQAIRTGIYQRREFMCFALQDMLTKKKAHPYIEQVQDMVVSIHPSCVSLLGALNMTGAPCTLLLADGDYSATDEMTHQFYIWWIFDLKRKGL